MTDAPAPAAHGHGGHHLDIKATMSKKIAGMPAWAWAVGLAGGLAVAYYLRGHSSGSADVAGDAMDGYDAVTDGTGGAATSEPGYYGTGGGGSTSDPADPFDYGSEGVEVGAEQPGGKGGGNAAWRQAAIAALVAAGTPYLRAQRAIDKYLAGGPINRRQAQLVNRAAKAVGSAPPKAGPVTIKHKHRDDKRPQPAPDKRPYDNQGRRNPGAGSHPYNQVKPNTRPAGGQEHRHDTGRGMAHDATRAPAGRATHRGRKVR